MKNEQYIKDFLDEKYRLYAAPRFIDTDPIQVPHCYHKKEDVEIAAFLTAILSWGQRTQIIKSAKSLLSQMGESPYEFVIDSNLSDIKALSNFYYRTFNGIDCMAIITSLKNIYINHNGLEEVFTAGYNQSLSVKGAIGGFRQVFLVDTFPERSKKHIPNVDVGSAAKRLNMFLRWMIRTSKEGVDFGLWGGIPQSALMLPLDVHTARVSKSLGLLARKQNDWRAVEEVTQNLSIFDPNDPVKYDYALFGLGVFEKF